MHMTGTGCDDGQAGRAMQDPDAAHLKDTDPGQDLCVGHQHEGELPDVGAGESVRAEKRPTVAAPE